MTTVPLSKAKTHLARLLSEAEELGEHVLITRMGRPAGVLVPVDEYEGLVETLDILADPEQFCPRALHLVHGAWARRDEALRQRLALPRLCSRFTVCPPAVPESVIR